MSRKQKKSRGKIVSNEFFQKENYMTISAFERAVKERTRYLKSAYWLYKDDKVGEVIVFRNKIGARVIAYDLPETSK